MDRIPRSESPVGVAAREGSRGGRATPTGPTKDAENGKGGAGGLRRCAACGCEWHADVATCPECGVAWEPPYSTVLGPPRRVTQTILYSDELNAQGVYGNCLQAALASLLGMELDAVPNLLTFSDWTAAFDLWLAGLGLTPRFEDYVGEPNSPCLLFGRSARGVGHIIVWFGPGDEWDPHPSRDGLTSRERVYYFDPRVAADA